MTGKSLFFFSISSILISDSLEHASWLIWWPLGIQRNTIHGRTTTTSDLSFEPFEGNYGSTFLHISKINVTTEIPGQMPQYDVLCCLLSFKLSLKKKFNIFAFRTFRNIKPSCILAWRSSRKVTCLVLRRSSRKVTCLVLWRSSRKVTCLVLRRSSRKVTCLVLWRSSRKVTCLVLWRSSRKVTCLVLC